jgi:VWFA-related protein
MTRALSLVLIVSFFGASSAAFSQQLVNMYVTVVNDRHQLIKGMKAENFKIFENDKAKEIKFFASDSEPVSVAIVFDLSASVTHNETDSSKNRVGWFRKSALDFIGLSRQDNEYTLISFGEDITPIADLVSREDAARLIQDDSKFVRPKRDGATPLFVAMKAAMDKLETSKLVRRVLIVMTDGYDNASVRSVKNDVDVAVRTTLIPVFTLAAYDPSTRDQNLAGSAEPRVASVSSDSGGRFFPAWSETDARNAAMFAATIVDNQYHLGFVPEEPIEQNKARKLQVKLEIGKDDAKMFQSPIAIYSKRYIPNM